MVDMEKVEFCQGAHPSLTMLTMRTKARGMTVVNQDVGDRPGMS